MASPASHTHPHTLTLTLSAPTATFHIVCFVSFRSVWFSVCFVFRFGFVLFEQGRGDRGVQKTLEREPF